MKFDLQTDPPLEGMTFALDRFADKLSDFSQLFDGFGEIFRSLMVRQFGSEGGLAGGWAALSLAYAAWKEEHYPGRPIGVLTGALRASMTGAKGYSEMIGRDEASFGMDTSSAAAEYGSYFSERRPVIKWARERSREFQRYAHQWAAFQIVGPGGSNLPPNVPSAFEGLA